jgi:quinol---cytochrome-c reductase cytochrome c subunit
MTRRRTRQALAATAALGTLLAAALAARGEVPPSGIVHQPGGSGQSLLRQGAGLYAANCSSCHGIAGRGVPLPKPTGAGNISGQGPPLIGVGARAPDFYLRTGRMPIANAGEEPERQRPFFNPREIRALVAYVASFGKGPPIPEPQPHDHLAEGLTLFTEHCAGCHQVVGEGGYVTGARVPTLKHASPVDIAEAVRLGPYVMPAYSRKDISDHDLDKIIAYVEASKSPADRGGIGIGHIGPVPEGIVAWLIAGVVLVGICSVIGRRLTG